MSTWKIEDVRASIEESIRRDIGRVYEFVGEAVIVGENEIRLLEVEWLSTLATHPDIVAHRVYKVLLRGDYVGDFTVGDTDIDYRGWTKNATFYPRCPAEYVELKMELPRQERCYGRPQFT